MSCPLEIEAHGTQLAAELRFKGQLDHDAFVAAAKASGLVGHVKRMSTSADGDPWGEWDNLRETSIEEVWDATNMMIGNRDPEPMRRSERIQRGASGGRVLISGRCG